MGAARTTEVKSVERRPVLDRFGLVKREPKIEKRILPNGGLEGPRTLNEAPFRIEGSPEKARLEDLKFKAEMGDPIAKERIRGLETVARKIEENKLKEIESSNKFKRGLSLLEAKSLEEIRSAKLAELGRILRTNINPAASDLSVAEHVVRYSETVDSLNEINGLMGSAIAEVEIRTNRVSADRLPSLLELAKNYSHSDPVTTKIENAVLAITYEDPKTAIGYLKEPLSKTGQKQQSDINQSRVAIVGLAAAGSEGLDFLIKAYCDTNPPEAKQILSRALGRLDLGIGSVVMHNLIGDVLFGLIENSKQSDLFAFKYLLSLGLADMIEDATPELNRLYRAVATSKDLDLKRITEKIKYYLSCLDEELKTSYQTKDKETILLLSLVKAILTDHGIKLTEADKFEEGEKALRGAMDLGEIGRKIPDIRYALAINLFAQGRSEQALLHLKKAIELDSIELFEMFMVFDKIYQIGNERAFSDIGRRLHAEVEIEKTTAIYVLGHIVKYKEALSADRANILLKEIMANRKLWDSLNERISEGKTSEFKVLLDEILINITANKPIVNNEAFRGAIVAFLNEASRTL
jgi:tetratricopeptide (TPR) repeat protein